MSEFNLLILNSMVMLFLEPEHLKQFVMQRSQGWAACDTQARSLPAILAKFTSAFFFAITCKLTKKVPPSKEEYMQLQEYQSEILL